LAEREQITKDNNKRELVNRGNDEIISKYGKRPSRKYRRALKLHEFQKGICPYTGDNSEINDIFNGRTQIDHVLPHSRTYNDNLGNLVLCRTEANQDKAEQSPYEAFSAGYIYNGALISYQMILDRVSNYPEYKQKYFMEDAMDRYKDQNAFLKRFEGDTRYLGKVAKEYLSTLFPEKNEAQVKVRVLTGGITSDLRYFWGAHNILDQLSSKAGEDDPKENDKTEVEGVKPKKNRGDNRHHLIDAVIIACADRSAILKFQTLRKRYNTTSEFHKSINSGEMFPAPWQNFRGELLNFIDDPRLVVQKKNHNPFGHLHDLTSNSVLALNKTTNNYFCSVNSSL
jgi:CRISPR-associated endonuclease Csn1